MRSQEDSQVHSVRSLFISDLHLGFCHSRVGEILNFLLRHEPEYLYLVGDSFDGFCFQSSWRWQPECNLIVSRLTELARRGTRIHLIIGNHDCFLREPMMQRMIKQSGLVEVAEEFHHQTADGRRFLVAHGDKFDDYENASKLTCMALNVLYDAVLRVNSLWSRLNSVASHGPRSLVGRLMGRLRSLGQHVDRFRRVAVRHARFRGCDGVICGHIHAPDQVIVEGVMYCNSGDWVESCTAFVEDFEGDLKLVWQSDSTSHKTSVYETSEVGICGESESTRFVIQTPEPSLAASSR